MALFIENGSILNKGGDGALFATFNNDINIVNGDFSGGNGLV